MSNAPVWHRSLAGWQTAAMMLVLASASLSIAVNQISLGLGLLLLLVQGLWRRRWPPRTGVEMPALLLALWAMAMIPLSDDPGQSLVFYRRFFLFAAFWTGLSAVGVPGARRRLFAAMALGAVAVSGYGIVQAVGRGGGLFSRRFDGTMNPMTSGVLLMMVLLVALGFLALGRRRRATWLRVAPVVLLVGVALLQTMTRSALLGLVTGIGAMILLARPRRFLVFVGAVVIATTVVYAVGDRVLPERMWRRISPDSLRYTTSGWGPRVEMWQGGWQMVKRHPLTGVGDCDMQRIGPRYYGDDETVYHGHLHSNPVMLAAIWGVPGLVLALVFLLWPLVLLVRRWRDLPTPRDGPAGPTAQAAWVLGAVGVWAGFFMAGFTEWYFGDAEAMVLYLGILGVALGPSGHRPRESA